MVQSSVFTSTPMPVQADWIDYNGHLNMAYYNVLFDQGVDQVFEQLGLGPDYAAERQLTTYTAEFHVCYVRELHLGDHVCCSFQLIDHDEKRMHAYLELHHTDGWLAATAESLSLHVDMTGPKVAPFPPDILARLTELHSRHDGLSRPERLGRTIGIRRKG